MKDIDTLLSTLKLQLNIEHPNLEECYTEGYLSYLQNPKEEEQAQYSEGSAEKESWLEGWWDAFYDQTPAIEVSHDIREETDAPAASNDSAYSDHADNFVLRVLEISGMIALSAIVGYQIFELVA